jgi:hypothetical protein
LVEAMVITNSRHFLIPFGWYQEAPEDALAAVIEMGSAYSVFNLFMGIAPDYFDKYKELFKNQPPKIQYNIVYADSLSLSMVFDYFELFYNLFTNAVHSISNKQGSTYDYVIGTRIKALEQIDQSRMAMYMALSKKGIPYDLQEIFENPPDYFNQDDIGTPRMIFPMIKSLYNKNPSESMIEIISDIAQDKLKTHLNKGVDIDLITGINSITITRYLSVVNFQDWVSGPMHKLGLTTHKPVSVGSKEYINTRKILLDIY